MPEPPLRQDDVANSAPDVSKLVLFQLHFIGHDDVRGRGLARHHRMWGPIVRQGLEGRGQTSAQPFPSLRENPSYPPGVGEPGTLFPLGGRGKREAAHRQPLSHSSPKTGLEWGTQQFLPVWQILWCTRWTHLRIGRFSHRLGRAGVSVEDDPACPITTLLIWAALSPLLAGICHSRELDSVWLPSLQQFPQQKQQQDCRDCAGEAIGQQ
jgi:hypothetical protein